MAPIGRLWGDLVQRQTKVILSVAALNDLEVAFPVSQFNFGSKPEEFVAKFPLGKIPAFEHSEGWTLVEGSSIARYLCDVGEKVKLLGSNAKEAAIVDQWVHFAEQEVWGPVLSSMVLIFGGAGPFQREALDKHVERLHRVLKHLEAHLATRSSGYVALDTLTLADLVVAGVVFAARRVSLGTAEVAQYPKIFAHYTKVTEDERVKQFWGVDRWPFVDVAVTGPVPFPL